MSEFVEQSRVLEAVAFYRCRWCGNVYERSWEKQRTTIAMMLRSSIKKALDAKAPPLMAVHVCDAKRRGVADLLGAKEKENYEHPAPV